MDDLFIRITIRKTHVNKNSSIFKHVVWNNVLKDWDSKDL